MQNLSHEVTTILEKLGNKDLNLIFPVRTALQILDKISKYQSLFLENDVKMRARLVKVCPEFLLIEELTRNQIMDRKNKLTEGQKDTTKDLILNLGLLICDLKDMKISNQSLPVDKQDEARVREVEMETKINEVKTRLSTAVVLQDDELVKLSLNSQMPVNYAEIIDHLTQIGELLEIGDKLTDLDFNEQKTLFGTIKTLNSFR